MSIGLDGDSHKIEVGWVRVPPRPHILGSIPKWQIGQTVNLLSYRLPKFESWCFHIYITRRGQVVKSPVS